MVDMGSSRVKGGGDMILNILCADWICQIGFLGGERGSYGVGCHKEQERELSNNMYIG